VGGGWGLVSFWLGWAEKMTSSKSEAKNKRSE
jgi:hypothetical protein